MGPDAKDHDQVTKPKYFGWVMFYATSLGVCMFFAGTMQGKLDLLGLILFISSALFLFGFGHLHSLGSLLRKSLGSYPSSLDRHPDAPSTWLELSPASLIPAAISVTALPAVLLVALLTQDIRALFGIVVFAPFFIPMLQATKAVNPNEVPS